MLSVTCNECHIKVLYAEYHYAECHYAERHRARFLSFEPLTHGLGVNCSTIVLQEDIYVGHYPACPDCIQLCCLLPIQKTFFSQPQQK